MIPLSPWPAPDILTASGRVGAARLTAMPRESPGSGYNCRKPPEPLAGHPGPLAGPLIP